MTRDKADRYLRALQGMCSCAENGESTAIAMHEIREAIEKQVPLKMSHGSKGYYCGACNSRLFESAQAAICCNFDYCPDCGQMIDFSV